MPNGITISGFTEFGDKMNTLAATFPRELDDIAGLAAATWQQGAVLQSPKDQGKLDKITSYRVSDGIWEISTGAGISYAPYMEWGTKSHVSVPAELSGYASQFQGGSLGGDAKRAIYEWVLRKGLPASAQWPVFIKIMREGVRAANDGIGFFFIQRPAAEAQLLRDLNKLISEL